MKTLRELGLFLIIIASIIGTPIAAAELLGYGWQKIHPILGLLMMCLIAFAWLMYFWLQAKKKTRN